MNSKNPIFIKSPFPPIDIKARNKFITYKNYLVGLQYLLDLMYPDYSELVDKLKNNVHPKKQEDLRIIQSLLLNSWNSELTLNFPGLFKKDLLKFSNHWAPVQSYYSVYLALRALILAKGITAKEGHNKTLRVTVHNFIQGEKLFPSPWKVLYSNKVFQNLPQNISPSRINSLENPFHFKNDEKKLWDCLCLFLKTTYDRKIERKCQKWKDDNPTIKGKPRKNLPGGQRERIANKSRPISIFDYFYRLRIRSNYKDADIFIFGSLANEGEYYFNALCNITDRTLFLIEYYIARYIGKKQMKQIIDKYKSADSLNINKNLKYNSIKRFKYYN